MSGVRGRLSRLAGSERASRLALLALAAVGGVLLLVVAVNRWAIPSDERAYWLAAQRLLAGQPLYDPAATAATPYAYWYPPVLAQVLAPVALVLPAGAFTVAWTALLLACLWWLAGRRVLVALALVAFPPVAVEFWFRNIHLVLAVLVVLAVRRSWLFPVAAALKLAPGVGIAWLVAAGRRREAAVAVGVGTAILAASVLVSPGAWRDWVSIAMARGPSDIASFLPIPYLVRAVLGLLLALIAGRLRAPWSGVGLVIAVTIALPTLWTTALSVLIAIVPLWRSPAASTPPAATPGSEAPGAAPSLE
jgi:hypothetical protein